MSVENFNRRDEEEIPWYERVACELYTGWFA